ncbi:MAG TPA: hypothetical protein VGJ73_17055 [Verrucomicrobiae bacterium]|jgi:hypothetical protein
MKNEKNLFCKSVGEQRREDARMRKHAQAIIIRPLYEALGLLFEPFYLPRDLHVGQVTWVASKVEQLLRDIVRAPKAFGAATQNRFMASTRDLRVVYGSKRSLTIVAQLNAQKSDSHPIKVGVALAVSFTETVEI